MNKKISVILLIFTICLSLNVCAALPSYWYSEGFSMTQGPEWYYLQVSAGTNDYTEMPSAGNFWGTANWSLGQMWSSEITPPTGAVDGAVGFKAPYTGVVLISAADGFISRKSADYTDGIRYKIMKNDTQIWPESGMAALSETIARLAFTPFSTGITTGDMLYFVINNGGLGSNGQDNTIWDMVVTYTEMEQPPGVDVTGVSIDNKEPVMYEGQETTLTATVYPLNAADRNVRWMSSDENTVEIDETTGELKVLSYGNVIITVYTNDGGFYDSMTVKIPRVTDEFRAYIKSADYKTSPMTDESLWRYQYLDENVYNVYNVYKDMTGVYKWWEKNGWTVGTNGESSGVSGVGVITQDEIAPGNKDAVVTFIVPKSGQYKVSSNGEIKVPADSSDGALIKIMKNNVQIWPENGWTVLTPGQGLDFSPVELSLNGGDRLHFIVNRNESPQNDWVKWNPVIKTVKNVDSVSLNKDTLSLKVFESEKLIAAVTPADADNTGLLWRSDDETVAVVSADGKVTALKVGVCNITAASVDGNLTGSCFLTVLKQRFIIEDFEKDAITAGGTVRSSFNITGNYENTTIYASLTLYKKVGEVYLPVSSSAKTVSLIKEEQLNVDLNVTAPNDITGVTQELIIWDSLESMHPILDVSLN
jgi:uncharacterized protein YjdB